MRAPFNDLIQISCKKGNLLVIRPHFRPGFWGLRLGHQFSSPQSHLQLHVDALRARPYQRNRQFATGIGGEQRQVRFSSYHSPNYNGQSFEVSRSENFFIHRGKEVLKSEGLVSLVELEAARSLDALPSEAKRGLMKALVLTASSCEDQQVQSLIQ